MEQVRYIVYSSDLEECSFIRRQKENNNIECISCVDARSAVYMATGICAQNKEMVMVCLDSGNASRSAFSGMTEAFYRQLPVVLVTFGDKLDYSIELGDVVFNHFRIHNEDEIESLLSGRKPMHIEILESRTEFIKKQCLNLQNHLLSVLDSNHYLYVGQGIVAANLSYKCKVVNGGMPECYEGALANILGASLAKLKDKYIGLVSEDEFIHDINTLGNINVNNRLLYIVVCDHKNDMILNFADSLSFISEFAKEDELENDLLISLVENKKPTLLMIYKED